MTQDVTQDGGALVSLTVDGTPVRVRVDVDEPLLVTLRDQLDLTAPRGTCGIGVCGTCAVMVDGDVVSSCLMLTVQARDRAVTTAHGLIDADGRLAEVQQAFVRHGAYQCSFCIPAMTLAVQAALDAPHVGRDVESVREELAGNLCRCGTYPQVLEAVAELVHPDRPANEGN